MDIDIDAANRKYKLAIEATSKGKIFFSKDDYLDEFNRGCDHICGLLGNAFQLFNTSSFSTCVFLAITAIEEIAKLEIALFRHKDTTKPIKKERKDLLFNHQAKHSIASQEVIAIGNRLPNAIGEERTRELLNMGEKGDFTRMREASLYFDRADGKFTTPNETFTKEKARDVLLFALEVWDDRLVGLTTHTNKLDKQMMEIFDKVAKS